MTKRVQHVRHDNAGSAAFLGKLGEITVNTGNKAAHVHDGINAGGTELARADLVNVAVAAAANAGKMSAQQAVELAQALIDIVANTAAITSNDVDIAANAALIATNIIDIAANAALIATNITNIATNTSGLASEITNRTNADTALQSQITTNDSDIADTVAKTLTNTNKLAGIEAGADVTDTANVTAAGALMDSEVDADIKTLVLPASTTISAFGRTLIDDAAASNARATLGLGGLAVKNSVTDTDIDANSVGDSELKTVIGSTTASLLISANATWTPPVGFYNFAKISGLGILNFEIRISGTWYTANAAGGHWCDGTNMRFQESSGNSITFGYQKLG